MLTVILRLTGPMQAWSTQPRRNTRPTDTHPTKSGVVGLIANALGRSRSDPLQDLAELLMGDRADQPGVIEYDFHSVGMGYMPLLPGNIIADRTLTRTAAESPTPWNPPSYSYLAPRMIDHDPRHGLPQAAWTGRNPGIITDAFLADAAFTVTLTGDDTLIRTIADAISHPARTLHLGRAGYLPCGPILHAVTDATSPHEALLAADPIGSTAAGARCWTESRPTGIPAHREHPCDVPAATFATRHLLPRTVWEWTMPSDATTSPPTPTGPDSDDAFFTPETR